MSERADHPEPPPPATPGEVLIQARGLSKRFAKKGAEPFTAVAGVDFEVRRGEVFGFLGPNGAGKSTTMRMIGCVSPSTGGSLRIFGLDPAADGPAIRARLGVVPQEDTLDTEMQVRDNLHVYGRYFGLPRAVIKERTERLLDFVQLTDRGGDKVEPLSGGMKRRLTIARSLINEPEILILDEPTTGLDPQARHVVWDRLYRLKQQGTTLILTTHYMDEAEQLCDRLVVMDKGRIAAEGTPRELIERYSTREVLELRFPPDEQDQAAEKVAGIADPTAPHTTTTTTTTTTDTTTHTTTPNPASPDATAPDKAAADKRVSDKVEVLPDRVLVYAHDGEAALQAVRGRGLEPVTALVRRSTLEDVFLTLTGRSLVD